VNQGEFEALMVDASKIIEGEIRWSDDDDHSPAVEFRADVSSEAGYPLFVRGSYNALARTLSYVLIHRAWGRIYGLDMGKEHHNPTCDLVGDLHKHRWSELFRDKEAYVPKDITAPVTDPVAVWRQFCSEARINHAGTMQAPPARQLELL
jgi:hypothetical protein